LVLTTARNLKIRQIILETMSRLFNKRISKEIQMYKNDNFTYPNLILRPTDDLTVWYFIVYDLQDTPYDTGVYYGNVYLPPEYPLKPPDFVFRTPNGRFEVDKKICTTFTGFHQDTYTSTWNIMTMMEGMISFMTDDVDTAGIGSMRCSDEEKKKYAATSLAWNKLQDNFNMTFPDIDTLINKRH
jgi:ubiquitin-protein ligase